MERTGAEFVVAPLNRIYPSYILDYFEDFYDVFMRNSGNIEQALKYVRNTDQVGHFRKKNITHDANNKPIRNAGIQVYKRLKNFEVLPSWTYTPIPRHENIGMYTGLALTPKT
jgi:hypothetical protein